MVNRHVIKPSPKVATTVGAHLRVGQLCINDRADAPRTLARALRKNLKNSFRATLDNGMIYVVFASQLHPCQYSFSLDFFLQKNPELEILPPHLSCKGAIHAPSTLILKKGGVGAVHMETKEIPQVKYELSFHISQHKQAP